MQIAFSLLFFIISLESLPWTERSRVTDFIKPYCSTETGNLPNNTGGKLTIGVEKKFEMARIGLSGARRKMNNIKYLI